MKVLYYSRGAGKTISLIRLASESNYLIVCPTQQDADRIWQMSKAMGLQIHLPITIREFVGGEYYSPGFKGIAIEGIRGIVIDDVDRCLSCLSKLPITAISLTKEAHEEN